ncbi:hypothetical protein O181_090236 [Austropuccinia psidii MF-1]|uniref:Uncharacterized protein n=1 Tax=Austropuccinia psidii MF-1 TaxID=1389203 RepID=A0A9Q3P8J1_9BASI|nr:hypothetical protein [Austropuccinia psidii MF-1]
MEGRKRAKKIKFIFRCSWQISRTFKGPGEDGEEEESYGTEGVPAPVGESQGTGRPTLAQSEPSLLVIMQQMTQIMANLQAALSSESSIPPV